MRRFRKITLLSLALSVLLLCGGCGGNKSASEVTATTVPQPISQSQEKGTSILWLSLASFAPEQGEPAQRNDWQADMILLLGMDAEKGMVHAVQLDPQTQVSFRLPSGGERTLPLAQIYSYGSGGSDTALRMCQEVAGLVGLEKIEHYVIFSPEAIGLLVELLSPVELEVTENVLDSSDGPTQPGTVTLDPESATALFGFPGESGDNSQHMANQRAVIRALYQALPGADQLEDLAGKMVMTLGENMQTDLTLSQMLTFLEQTEEMSLTDSIGVYGQGGTLW